MKRTFDISPWHVKTSQWAPEDKRLQESMTSLANENLGMRGFYEEGYSGDETLEGFTSVVSGSLIRPVSVGGKMVTRNTLGR